MRNVGGGRPGEIDRAVARPAGQARLLLRASAEERSRWEPLHVERGFRPEQSTVTAFAGCAPTGIVDQLSRDGASLATSYGLALAAASHPRQRGYGEVVLVVPPEHVDTFARDGWTKARVREQIQRASAAAGRASWRATRACAIGLTAAEVERLGAETPVPKFRSGRRDQAGRRRRRGRQVRGPDRQLGRRRRLDDDDRGDRGVTMEILDPTDERRPIERALSPSAAARSTGAVALLDISKPRGDVLIDRLEERLRERLPGVTLRRYRKPTFTKPAPEDLRREILRDCGYVIEALAD